MDVALLITGRDAEGLLRARVIEQSPWPTWMHEGQAGLVAAREEVRVLPTFGRVLKSDHFPVPNPYPNGDALPELGVGSVIVAQATGRPGDEGEPKDTILLQIHETLRVLGHADEEAGALTIVAAWMNAAGDGSSVPDMKTMEHLAFEARAGRIDAESNEALVAAWLNDEGKLDHTIIEFRGPVLHWDQVGGEGLGNMLVAQPDGPGLWLLRDAREWTSRDWESGTVDDYGLEGEMEQVTLEAGAAHFGKEPSAVLAKLEEQYPYILDVPVLEALHLPAGDAETVAPGMNA